MKKISWMILISFFFIPIGIAKIKKIQAEAFRQSIKLLRIASSELVESIKAVDFPMWKESPERKKILLNILPYDNLAKLPGTDKISKGGELLSMDHEINPHLLLIYKPFYFSYAGTADSEFEEKLPEIKKMLLIEAALTWRLSENDAEIFAKDFLKIAMPDVSVNPESSCKISEHTLEGCAVKLQEIPELPGVELTNFVDPLTSAYVTKLTLPKNFIGYLYLSGLNITSLSKYQVKVRFRFGREQRPIDIETSIGRTQGIIPSSDKEVLQLDMTTRPFNDVRLLYDLYDYTDYRNKDGVEEFLDQNENLVGPLFTSEDSRNYNLYCRGLNLEDDPTFKYTPNNYFCDEVWEKCLYAYAKVVDKSLVNEENSLAYSPSSPQLDSTGLGYIHQTYAQNIFKNFPDNDSTKNLKGVLNAKSVGNNGDILFYDDQIIFENGKSFLYQGPFRTIGHDKETKKNTWEIIGDALIYPPSVATQSFGLFQKSYIASDPNSGYISMLFPRSGKIDLKANTEYWGSPEPLGVRSLQKMETGGPSLYMDGSNLRVKNYNAFTNEGVSSCNVTATIDLIATNPATGKEVSLLKNPDRQLKLQLTRPTLIPLTGGPELLYQSLQNCSNNNECSSDQCCFSNRCWDKKLVSGCMETNREGNGGTGEICQTDYDCASFCCKNGTCGVHIISEQETFLCAKAPGQTCVTKEYCRKENIAECKIIKTGTDSNGKITCALKCYNKSTFGDCRNGYCIAPMQPLVPAFDPKNPNCTNAEDPPLSVN